MLEKKTITSVQISPRVMVVAVDSRQWEFFVFTRKHEVFVYTEDELMDEFDLTEEDLDDIDGIIGGNIFELNR